jgi:hypothetical protein
MASLARDKFELLDEPASSVDASSIDLEGFLGDIVGCAHS